MPPVPPPGFVISLLDKRHNRQSFRCGEEALDRYLAEQAGQEARKYVSATYVLTEEPSVDVVGYYSISAASIPTVQLSGDALGKVSRHSTLPAILLARLAVSQSCQQRRLRLGEFLLMHALHKCLALSRQLGSVAVVVDAKPTAVAFYRKYGFKLFPEQERAMFLSMAAIAKVFPDA